MALNTPINVPLTDSQAELTAKIGSMKNLLSLPIIKAKYIPKNKQISTHDYLLRILESLGINPSFLFMVFINNFFSEKGDWLVDKIFMAIAKTLAQGGTSFGSRVKTEKVDLTEELILQYTGSNYSTINNSSAGSGFRNAIANGGAMLMAKKFTMMLFGTGSNSPTFNGINQAQRDKLAQESICSSMIFSVSNDTYEKKSDLEYNRVKRLKEIEKGAVTFKISCQGVDVTLPEDPVFIFEGGGVNTIGGATPPTAPKSMELLITHVENEVQRANSERNVNAVGKSFRQTFVERLISSAQSLLFEIPISPGSSQYALETLFAFIATTPAGDAQGITLENTIYSSCAIGNDPNSIDKKRFFSNYVNSLLKALLLILLLAIIREFKRLVKNYFARTALEKVRRRIQKIKMKFQIFGKIIGAVEKAAKFAAAVAGLSGILGDSNM